MSHAPVCCVQVRKAYKLYRLGGVVSEILYSPAAYGLDLSAKNMPRPKARIGAQVSGSLTPGMCAGCWPACSSGHAINCHRPM